MDRLLLTLSLSLWTLLAGAQPVGKLVRPAALLRDQVYPARFTTGLEALPALPVAPSPWPHLRAEPEQIIGETLYDLQTNNSMQHRLVRRPDGTFSASWTIGLQASGGFPDRGSGYNHFDGTSWEDSPSSRLEMNLRTGWPAIGTLADGRDVILCHASPPPYKAHILRQDEQGSWEEFDIPSTAPDGLLWPRMAIGGPNGNTIHAIAITTPSGLSGAPYNGVDGQLLYFRSTDGGDTWDITDMVIPAFGPDYFTNNDADSYAIDADSNYVAIALFNSWNDVVLAKSNDNGQTWTRYVLNDFPLDNYQVDQGYTFDDLNGFDPAAPDSLAIFTSDNSGTVLIDRNGMAHAWFGRMYVIDSDFTDGATQYYPAMSGILYWNETFGNDSLQLIADLVDANDNDTIDIQSINNIALYFTSLTSFPSAGVDAQNNIYLAYSAVAEDKINENATKQGSIVPEHYRHVYVIASIDGGMSWTAPYDIINPDISDPDLIDFTEAVFPSVARNVLDEQLHLTYQQDFEPGLAIRGDEDDPASNYIMHVRLDLAELFGVVATSSPTGTLLELQLSPNPVWDQLRIQIKGEAAAPQLSLQIVDAMGRVYTQRQLPFQPIVRTDVSHLPKGVYWLRIQVGSQILSHTFVKM